MGLMDMLKFGWAGSGMSQNDRKKIFWYLKRKTSYTAWLRTAEAFDAFAVVFKKQVKEQPYAPGSIFGPFNWEEHYVDILRGQVMFEQGLAALRTNDHSVWRNNDRGLLDDALMIANHWYNELIYGGERMDHQYFGMYLDELKTAIEAYSAAWDDIGYLEPDVMDTPASEHWGEWLQCTLNHEMFPRNPDPGFPQRIYGSLMVFPNPLPDLPEPAQDLRLKTGELVTVDGIYEPQVKDGCMNYLIKDTAAPLLAVERGEPRPVLWKLVWEDVRYIDGQIPAEERMYFQPESAPQIAQSIVTSDVVFKLSGEVCPLDGHWAVMDELNTKLELRRGVRMPQSHGRDVTWVWVGK